MSTRDDLDDEDEKPPLLALITDNWTLKLAALVMSVALYVMLHGGGESMRTLEVDLIRGP